MKLETLQMVQENFEERQRIYKAKCLVLSIVIGTVAGISLAMYGSHNREPMTNVPTTHTEAQTEPQTVEVVEITTDNVKAENEANTEPQTEDIQEELYCDSLEYLACCIEAEAGDQTELGMRLVIDVILNRVDSDKFPNNIYDVINQQGQFEVVSNGRIDCIPQDIIYQLIAEELEMRTNNEVLYFKMYGYHTFAEPVLQEQDHYFCK